MSDEVTHNCGLCVAHTLHDVYSFIGSLQHRGREAAGIAAIGDDRIDVIKWKGTVSRFELEDLYKIFPGFAHNNYHTFMAHVRYATRGKKENILRDAHPQVIGGKTIERGDHTIILDCESVAVHNGQVAEEYFNEIDKNDLKTECDTEAFLHYYQKKGEYEILRQIPAAYTIAIADKRKKEIIVLRDRTGVKPGVLGWKDSKFCVTSEDIALRKNGGKFIEDLIPGCAYYLAPNGNYRKEKIVEQKPAYCFFEYNYIADVDSVLNGVSVRKIRRSLGDVLAEEFHPKEIDLVTFLPRCPEVAARAYAEKIALPFAPVFYKVRGERSFQGSTSADREKSINENLYLLPGMDERLKGQTVVVIDDSIIRGNNSRRGRYLLYEVAGVKEAHFANYTPELCITGDDGIDRGCTRGVDMPPTPPPGEEYIARGRTREEINQKMRAPVDFISSNGMLNSFERLGIPRENLCYYCIGGNKNFK